MSKRKPFAIDELRLNNDSEEEQNRTRQIFEALKKIASANGFMTEHEKNFFCLGVKISLLNDGQVSDYPCCENFSYKDLFLTYASDITGAGLYKKVRNAQYLPVSNEEKWIDLNNLYDIADKWGQIITVTNHTEQLLQRCSKEARDTINELNNQPEFNLQNDPFARGKFLYKYKRWSNLLYSKFIYLMAKETFQGSVPGDFIFTLSGQTIEMNEYSIIHILSRHYAEVSKKFNTGKSYLQKDFKPRELHHQFREILSKIDASGLLQPNDIFKIPFAYKNVPHLIWIKEDDKQVPGQKGNVKYLRLETFYPVEEKASLDDLSNNYELVAIDENLSLYKPK